MENIIHVNNEWYYDTKNEVHIQKEAIESYINFLNNKNNLPIFTI